MIGEDERYDVAHFEFIMRGLQASREAMPDKALAGSGPHHLFVLSGTDPRTGVYFVDYETVAGGMGARATRDGVREPLNRRTAVTISFR